MKNNYVAIYHRNDGGWHQGEYEYNPAYKFETTNHEKAILCATSYPFIKEYKKGDFTFETLYHIDKETIEMITLLKKQGIKEIIKILSAFAIDVFIEEIPVDKKFKPGYGHHMTPDWIVSKAIITRAKFEEVDQVFMIDAMIEEALKKKR